MNTNDVALEQFVALSAILTGYERVELLGTGLSDTYWKTVTGVVGDAVAGRLLQVATSILERSHGDADATDAAVRADILASATLGPVARNIIQLWYLGSWIQLPQAWRSEVGTSPNDTTRVVSAEAYQQSLVYQAMRTHPAGAKQPGYGSWAMSPDAIETNAGASGAEEKTS